MIHQKRKHASLALLLFGALAFSACSQSMSLPSHANPSEERMDDAGTYDGGADASADGSPDSALPEETAECAVLNATCEVGGCCDGWCADTGFGELRCSPKVSDGDFCGEHRHCASGFCDGSVCRVSACASSGGACSDDSPCCEGLSCNSGTCLPEGSCRGPEDCDSGHCADGACIPAPGMCAEIGARCGEFGRAETECCGEDTFCDISQPYVRSVCRRRLSAGEACLFSGNSCLSGVCGDGICRSAECSDERNACFYDTDCCSGFCRGGGGYVRGECAAPGDAGEPCFAAHQCASRACHEGACR